MLRITLAHVIILFSIATALGCERDLELGLPVKTTHIDTSTTGDSHPDTDAIATTDTQNDTNSDTQTND